MSGAMLSVRQVAAELGWDVRETRARLQKLHDKHGRILFRHARGRNAKIWVDTEALAKAWPTKFGPPPQGAEELEALKVRIGFAQELAGQTLKEIARLSRKVDAIVDNR